MKVCPKLVGVAAGAFVVGGVAGYFVARNIYRAKFARIASEEIESVKETYRRRSKEGPYSEPQAAYEALKADPKKLADYKKVVRPKKEVPDYTKVVRGLGYSRDEAKENPFRDSLDGVPPDDHENYVLVEGFGFLHTSLVNAELPLNYVWEEGRGYIYRKPGTGKMLKDQDERFPEIDIEDVDWSGRSPDKPYLISWREFEQGVDGYDRLSVIYFQTDDILTEKDERIIDDVDGTVGQDNLERFGQGSGDTSVAYVRNERLGVDFEITREPFSFAEIVLGYTPDDRKPG